MAATRCLILDSEALSRLARGTRRQQEPLAAALKSVLRGDGEVVTSSAVLAELLRGRHDGAVWSALTRLRIATQPVDDRVATRAGHLLGRAKLSSEHAVDAFVVATASAFTPAVVLTGDTDDLSRLAADLDSVEVVGLG